MVAFLMSMDRKTWKLIINRRTLPTIKTDDDYESLKPKKIGHLPKMKVFFGNSRALNANYNDVDKNIFRINDTCVSPKAAYETLEVSHEGASKVFMSRL